MPSTVLPIARRHLVAKKRPKTTCNDVPFVSVGDDTLGDDASRRARDGDRPHAEGEETGNGTTDGADNDGRSHGIDDALVSVLNSGGPCPYLHNPELVSSRRGECVWDERAEPMSQPTPVHRSRVDESGPLPRPILRMLIGSLH